MRPDLLVTRHGRRTPPKNLGDGEAGLQAVFMGIRAPK